MTLKDEERTTLVQIRTEKASKTLEDAKKIIEGEMWSAAANRLYYAAYYAVSALLLKNGISVRTHEGIIRMFGMHFVKNGIVSSEMGTTYSKLFSLRLTEDYDDDYNLTENDVLPKVKDAENLIEEVLRLIKNGQSF